MNKEKVAIAIEPGLLRHVDSLVDGFKFKSRSQVISFFLQRGLRDQAIKKAAILLHRSHHRCALALRDNKPYILHQLELFAAAGISDVYILTQESESLEYLKAAVQDAPQNTQVIVKESQSTGDSVYMLKEYLEHHHFIVMSGDTFNNFDLIRMVLKHFESQKIATIGLVNRPTIKDHGVVLLDGTLVIDFEEKPKSPKSHIVNAGIYIFRPEVFEFLNAETQSLERDVFPKLAKIKQLHGYFTHGEYIHITEHLDKAP